MKKCFLHLLLLAGLFGTLTTSCSQEADDPVQTSEGKVQVCFTVAMDNRSSGSRATWGESYTPSNTGNEYENKINPAQFTVKLIPTGSTTEIPLTNVKHYYKGENVYEFVGEVETTAATFTGKIMVFANMTGTTDDTTFRQDADYIPMWGVQTTTLTFTPGQLTTLANPIYLLRAMAKVEVMMVDAVTNDGYTLGSVTLDKYNTTGYCLPNGWNTTTVTNTEVLTHDECFREYASANAATSPLNLTPTGTNHFICYIPECANPSDALTMSVTVLKNGVDITRNLNDNKLYFHDYASTDKTPFNIVRNHWYQYTITKVNDGFDLTVVAQPWTLQSIPLSFTDVVTYEVDGWDEATYNKAVSSGNTIYMTKSGETPVDAVFTFRIETPEDADYRLELSNNTDFTLSYTKTDDGSIQVTVKANDTAAEYPYTELAAYVKDKYDRWVEIDLTGTGEKSNEGQGATQVSRYLIRQNWE